MKADMSSTDELDDMKICMDIVFLPDMKTKITENVLLTNIEYISVPKPDSCGGIL